MNLISRLVLECDSETETETGCSWTLLVTQ
jgi:hypothetical protein